MVVLFKIAITLKLFPLSTWFLCQKKAKTSMMKIFNLIKIITEFLAKENCNYYHHKTRCQSFHLMYKSSLRIHPTLRAQNQNKFVTIFYKIFYGGKFHLKKNIISQTKLSEKRCKTYTCIHT